MNSHKLLHDAVAQALGNLPLIRSTLHRAYPPDQDMALEYTHWESVESCGHAEQSSVLANKLPVKPRLKSPMLARSADQSADVVEPRQLHAVEIRPHADDREPQN